MPGHENRNVRPASATRGARRSNSVIPAWSGGPGKFPGAVGGASRRPRRRRPVRKRVVGERGRIARGQDGPRPRRKPEAAICSMRRESPRRAMGMERVKGIEPSYSAWKAAALPLSYTRLFNRLAVQRRATRRALRALATPPARLIPASARHRNPAAWSQSEAAHPAVRTRVDAVEGPARRSAPFRRGRRKRPCGDIAARGG